MSSVAGNLVLDSWTVLDAATTGTVTGVTVPAGITIDLRRQSGSTIIAASEVVAWTEIGATGSYYFSFTPTVSGLYVVTLNELHASSAQRKGIEFRFQVLAAGAVFAPSYANAFCAETDVERYLLQTITTTSKPTDTETAGFAEERAAALMTLCAGLGNAVTPASVTAGSRLEDLLRAANAIGAALDVIMAQAFDRGVSPPGKAEHLLAAWVEYFGGTPPEGGKPTKGLIAMEITTNLVSLSTSHVLSGDTTARAAENAPQDVGLQVRMGDLY